MFELKDLSMFEIRDFRLDIEDIKLEKLEMVITMRFRMSYLFPNPGKKRAWGVRLE
jgi:hypothetical protein